MTLRTALLCTLLATAAAGALAQAPAPATPQVDARQHHFFDARGSYFARHFEGFFYAIASALAARHRDGAKRAEIVLTFLQLWRLKYFPVPAEIHPHRF